MSGPYEGCGEGESRGKKGKGADGRKDKERTMKGKREEGKKRREEKDGVDEKGLGAGPKHSTPGGRAGGRWEPLT